jgi:hypothetical protein
MYQLQSGLRGTVAAPLLAGFSFTLAGLVLQLIPTRIMRWPDLALLLFVMAGFFLIACIQFAFWAERWNISPADIRMWWPSFDESEALRQYLYAKQAYHAERYDRWVGLVRLTYNSGIMAFDLCPSSNSHRCLNGCTICGGNLGSNKRTSGQKGNGRRSQHLLTRSRSLQRQATGLDRAGPPASEAGRTGLLILRKHKCVTSPALCGWRCLPRFI